MTDYSEFKQECQKNVANQVADADLRRAASSFMSLSFGHKYSYNFEILGRPIIQYPQDIVAMQELIWTVKPDLIVETGIAHGGSLVMNAAMLTLLDVVDALDNGDIFDPAVPGRLVLGVDVDIRAHNRVAIENHALSSKIKMIEGSSIAESVIDTVRDIASKYRKVMVCLDSNHTHDHVMKELELYAPLVSMDSYCVVFDTVVEELPDSASADRPWGKGDNPKTAVKEYLARNSGFVVDYELQNKLLITVAPDGYLKRVGQDT